MKASQKALIDGAIAGIAPGIVEKMFGNVLGGFTQAAALGVVGHFRKNPTLMTLAGFELGQALSGGLVGALGGGNGGGQQNGGVWNS